MKPRTLIHLRQIPARQGVERHRDGGISNRELLEVSAVAIPANPDALAPGVKSGAIAKADLREAMALFRALAGAESPEGKLQVQWLEVARELGRVMQKA